MVARVAAVAYSSCKKLKCSATWLVGSGEKSSHLYEIDRFARWNCSDLQMASCRLLGTRAIHRDDENAE